MIILAENADSLQKKFKIKKIDIDNRLCSGIYLDDKIITGKEHLECVRNYKRQNKLSPQSKGAFLHFVNKDNKLICFIDNVPILPFGRANLDDIVKAINSQFKDIHETYLYQYPDSIYLINYDNN